MQPIRNARGEREVPLNSISPIFTFLIRFPFQVLASGAELVLRTADQTQLPAEVSFSQSDDYHLTIDPNFEFVPTHGSPKKEQTMDDDYLTANIDADLGREDKVKFVDFEIRFKKPDHQALLYDCLLYTSPSPRDRTRSRMPSSA